MLGALKFGQTAATGPKPACRPGAQGLSPPPRGSAEGDLHRGPRPRGRRRWARPRRRRTRPRGLPRGSPLPPLLSSPRSPRSGSGPGCFLAPRGAGSCCCSWGCPCPWPCSCSPPCAAAATISSALMTMASPAPAAAAGRTEPVTDPRGARAATPDPAGCCRYSYGMPPGTRFRRRPQRLKGAGPRWRGELGRRYMEVCE